MPTGVYIRTEEQKQRMRTINIGRPSPKRGIPLSQEQKDKISKTLKEYNTPEIRKERSERTKKYSANPDVRKRLSLQAKGQKASEETRKKISDALKGHPSWSKGRHHTKEARQKMSLAQRGEKCHFWKGGKCIDDLRKSVEYRKWRVDCLERDNYTCQKTGVRGGSLEVHHINNFADFPESRLEVDNGITLSKKVHRKFHSIYGKNNTTREQLEEFFQEAVIPAFLIEKQAIPVV